MAEGFPVQFQSPSQVMAIKEKEKRALTPLIPESAYTNLSSYLKLCWTDAVNAKREIQSTMLSCAKIRKGEYEDDKLAAIQEETHGGSEAYIRAVNTKCQAAYNNIYDIYNSLNEATWSISPTPVPELPTDLQMESIVRVQQEIMSSEVPLDEPQIMELDTRAQKEIKQALDDELKNRTDKMAKRIEDILTEGGWQEALNQCLNDLVTYPAAIMKGPILRKVPKKKWVKDDFGKTKLVVVDTLVWEWERVSPFDFYPQRNIENINDGYCFHRLHMNRRKIEQMKGVKGYNDTEIDAVLSESNTGTLTLQWLSTEDYKGDEAEDKDNMTTSPEGRIDGLEFWGSVSGKMLREWGMSEKDIPDENKEYDITAILIGTHVIRAVLNHNPLHKKPYHKESWEKLEGQFWGSGIPQKASDIGNILNNAVRALSNNIAYSSGPMCAVDYSQLPVGQQIEFIKPWMLLKLDPTLNMGGLSNSRQLPITFFQPKPMVTELLAVINAFMKLLDEYSGIPAYTYGVGENQGAGDTASGLKMLMGAAGKAISNVSSRIDQNIIVSSIGMIYDYLMLYDPDESIKGDAEIKAGGVSSFIAKGQQTIRTLELLDRTRNDVDMQIIGMPGRAELLRIAFHGYDPTLDRIIPDKEELEKRDQVMQQMIQMEKMAKTGNLDQAKPQNLDNAGSPVSGTDNAQFLPLQGSNTA